MPTIPVATPLGYAGVFFVIAGIFLVIAGLDILKIEKLTITTGRKTWGTGLILAIVGLIFLLPDINSAIEPIATPTPVFLSATPDLTTTTSIIATEPQATVLETLTPELMSTPLTPQEQLLLARQWDLMLLDDFSADANRENWEYVTEPNDPVIETFDLTFKLDVVTNGNVQYAFYNNKNVKTGEHFFASVEAIAKSQTGCDYGLIFRVDPVGKQYYWFYINDDNEFRVVSKVKGQNDYHESLVDATPIPSDLSVKSLSVIGDGSKYSLFINETRVGEFADDRLKGTGVGIGTITCQFLEKASFVFDNFEVRTNSSTTSGSKLLLYENFDNNNRGWPTGDGIEDEFTVNRNIENKMYIRSLQTNEKAIDGSYSTNQIPGIYLKNFCLFFDAKFSSLYSDASVVVIARAKDYSDDDVNNSYYYFTLYGNGTSLLWVDPPGEGNSHVFAEAANGVFWNDNNVHTIRISLQENILEIYDENISAMVYQTSFSNEDFLSNAGEIRIGIEVPGPNQTASLELDNFILYDKCP